MAEHDPTTHAAPELSLGRRVLIYFGLAGDPRVAGGRLANDPLELYRPARSPVVWIVGLPVVVVVLAVVRHLHGVGWVSIVEVSEVAFLGSLLAGVVLGLARRWLWLRRESLHDRLAELPGTSPSVVKPAFFDRYLVFLLSLGGVAINPQSQYGMAMLWGVLLGTTLGQDLVHWRLERQVGTPLFMALDDNDGRFYRRTTLKR